MKYLYSKTKVFHFKDRLDIISKDNNNIPAPIHIRLKPTNYCNHSCYYCAYSANNRAKFGKDHVVKAQIPEKKMMELINDFASIGVKAVTFSGGGEPFMYSHFSKTLQHLQKTSIKFGVITNGAKLYGEPAKIFAESGAWVRVSMDGWSDESYVNSRNVAYGEYSKIISNMEKFVKNTKKCLLGVSLIIDKKSVGNIYNSLARLKNIGVSSVKLSPCLVSDMSNDTNSYHRNFFLQVKEEIENSIVSLMDSNFEISDAYNELSEKYEKNYCWCPHIQLRPVVGADLNVYSCPDKAYNYGKGLLGSIENKSFKQFWFDDKNKFFKINPSKDCLHHCELNQRNILLHEFINSDKEHLNFI